MDDPEECGQMIQFSGEEERRSTSRLSEIAALENNLTIHLAAFLLNSCFSLHLQKHLL